MELKWLRAFTQVAALGQLGRAAQRLHLTQPALSRQIKQLEQALGVTLFRRTGRGMELTEAGALLQERAPPLLKSLDQVAAELSERSEAIAGPVVLAVPPSIGSGLAADMVERCRRRYPAIELRLVVALSGAVREGLLRGRYDLGLLYEPLPRADLEIERLWQERLWCVAHPEAGLDPQRAIRMAEVLGDSLVLPGARHGLRLLVEEQAARLELRPRVAVEVDSLRVLVELVRRGVGRTLLPRHAVATELAAGLVSIAPVIRPVLRRLTMLGWPRAVAPSPAVLAVAEVVREQSARARRE